MFGENVRFLSVLILFLLVLGCSGEGAEEQSGDQIPADTDSQPADEDISNGCTIDGKWVPTGEVHAGGRCDRCAEGYANYPDCVPEEAVKAALIPQAGP